MIDCEKHTYICMYADLRTDRFNLFLQQLFSMEFLPLRSAIKPTMVHTYIVKLIKHTYCSFMHLVTNLLAIIVTCYSIYLKSHSQYVCE